MSKRALIFILLCMILMCLPISAYASNDKNYNIISPNILTNGIFYGDNLLISIRVEENVSLNIDLYNYPNYTESNSLDEVRAAAFIKKETVYASEYLERKNHICFYTKLIKNISPGLYSISIDTLDGNEQVIDTYNKYFIIKPNSAKVTSTIYQSKPSNKVKFFQSVFKSLFG